MKTLAKNQATKKFAIAVILLSVAFQIGMAKINLSQTDTPHMPETPADTVSMEVANPISDRINGFSMNDILGTVQAIQADPDIARFEFRVKNKWIQGGHNRSWIKDFYGGGIEDQSRPNPFVYDNSEPPVLLGNNEGPNPVEYLLHGLAGCMTTTMVLHAAAHGIELKSVESSLEGDLDVQGFLGLNDTVRNGYQDIRVNFKLEGDLTEEQKQQLESFVRLSPVFDIVTNQVPVEVSLNY